MKRMLFVTVAMLLLLATVPGCTATAGPSPTQVNKSGLVGEIILMKFEEMLEPISEVLSSTRLDTVAMDDGGFCQVVVVTDKISDRTHHIHVYSNSDGYVDTVLCDSKKWTYTETNFALLSYYLYSSMGLKEMEAQDFYDYFNLLTREPDGTLVVDDWELNAFASGEYLTFGFSYKPDN